MLCSVIKHSGWGYSTQPEGEKHSTTLHVSSLHFIRVDKSKGRDSKGCFANFVQRRLKTSLKKLKAPFFSRLLLYDAFFPFSLLRLRIYPYISLYHQCYRFLSWRISKFHNSLTSYWGLNLPHVSGNKNAYLHVGLRVHFHNIFIL